MNRQQQWVSSNGARVNVVTEGEHSSPAIILVHGYPDNLTVWDQVAAHLSKAWYVIRYDVRGAGYSDRPKTTADYRLAQLSDDLLAVAETIIPGRPFHLAGHDWGSIQSWESVATEPLQSRIQSFTSISGPCLDHVGFWARKQLTGSPTGLAPLLRQIADSWYIGAFHIPFLAPLVWNSPLGKHWHRYLARTEQVKNDRHNPHQAADGRDGIRLYRANMLPRLASPRVLYANCPVQLMVPTRDRYIGTRLTEDLNEWVPALYRREIDAGHWVLLTQPAKIAGFIEQFAGSIESKTIDPELEAYRRPCSLRQQQPASRGELL